MTDEERKKIKDLAGHLARSEYHLRGLLNALSSMDGIVALQEDLREFAESRRPLRLADVLTEGWLPERRLNRP